MKKIPLRKAILVLVPILAIAGALAVYSNLPKNSQILLEGSVEIASTTCFAQAGGRVASVLVQPGQSVKQGELLAVLDDSAVDDQAAMLKQTLAIKEAQLRQLQAPLNLEAQLAARRAAQANVSLWEENLAQVQSQLETAQRALTEQQTLYEAGAIALVELRQYEQAVKSAQSQVVTTQAQLSAAQNNVQAIALPTADEQAIAAAQADLELTKLQLDQLEHSRENYRILAAADGVVISISLDEAPLRLPARAFFSCPAGTGNMPCFTCPRSTCPRWRSGMS